MATDEADKRSWTDLCASYERAVSEFEVAMLAVQSKMAAGVEPTLEELVRLQNAHVAQQDIARQIRNLGSVPGGLG